jgi:hypothetical protein
MMMIEMGIETSVYYVYLTRLIAREDYIKFIRRESTKTYTCREVGLDVNTGTTKYTAVSGQQNCSTNS